MHMSFDSYPHVLFVTFSSFNLVILYRFLPKHIDTGYLVNTTPHTIFARFSCNFAGVLSRSEDAHVKWM